MTSPTQSAPSAVSDELVGILRDDLDLKCEPVAATTHLVDDLGMDSVAFAVALVAVEDRFGAQLTEEDLLSCKTVGDLQSAIDLRASA
jgi:acyl carrier protein